MPRIPRAVDAGTVSVALIALGLALVVVAVGGSPAPWYAAVAVAALELLGAGYVIGRNATEVATVDVASECEPTGKPRTVKAAA